MPGGQGKVRSFSLERGDHVAGETLEVLGLVEDRVEDDETDARSGQLADPVDALLGRPPDGDAGGHVRVPVVPPEPLRQPLARAVAIAIDGDVDALAHGE